MTRSGTYRRFVRGRASIKPNYALYGYKIACTCGKTWQLNDGRKSEAVGSYRRHGCWPTEGDSVAVDVDGVEIVGVVSAVNTERREAVIILPDHREAIRSFAQITVRS